MNKIIDNVKNKIRQHKWMYILLCAILVATLSVLYFKNKGGITHLLQVILNTWLQPNVNSDLNSSLTQGMFGYIGTFQAQFPLWLIFIDISVLTIFFLVSNETENKIAINTSYSVVSFLMVPLHILIVTVGMYFEWTPVVLGNNAIISSGGQGRYFTPFLIYLAPLFMKFNGDSIRISKNKLNFLLMFTILLNIFMMLYLMLFTYWLPDYKSNWLLTLRNLF